MSFAFDASRPAGGRVLQGSVKVQGKLLQHEALYRVGTKAYLLQGKDGYGSFADVRPTLALVLCLLSAGMRAPWFVRTMLSLRARLVKSSLGTKGAHGPHVAFDQA